MNELVLQIQDVGNYATQKEAKNALASVVAAISNTVAEGDDVKIKGFGSFVVADVKGRTGKVAGKTYTSEDKKVVRFKIGSKLKNAALKAI